MTKVSLFALFVIAMLSACNSSPRDKADAIIKEDLPKSLIKADSYDPIETKVDSAFAPYDLPAFHEQVIGLIKMGVEMQGYIEKAKQAKSSMAMWSNPYDAFSRNEYQENKAEYEEYMEKQKALEKRIKKSAEKIRETAQEDPEFIGFKAFHRYRTNNNAGQTLLGEVLYIFNKNFTQILAVYDTDSEEYIAFQQLMKQMQEEN